MMRSAALRLAGAARRSLQQQAQSGSSSALAKLIFAAEEAHVAAPSWPAYSRITRSNATVAKAEVPTAISKEAEIEIEHATGVEQEELIGDAEGKPRFELGPPTGPFGTKEAPAIVESQFDERLVGCTGGVGEEEHDVVWFHLKKDAGHDCTVCGQVFQLKVIGEGGKPGQHH